MAVEGLILKAMAKDPSRRYRSAVQMREAIDGPLSGRQEKAEPAGAPEGLRVRDSRIVFRAQSLYHGWRP